MAAFRLVRNRRVTHRIDFAKIGALSFIYVSIMERIIHFVSELLMEICLLCTT